MIFVIDDDKIMAECIVRATSCEAKIFGDAISAMDAVSSGNIPELIFLDVLLDGPDAFTFLNELMSYDDTGKIPIVIVSSLDYSKYNLSAYGVVGFLNKESMKPKDIKEYVDNYVAK